MTFESDNVDDLKEKIEAMWNASFNYKDIAENAVKRYSSEAYYEKLMELYKVESLGLRAEWLLVIEGEGAKSKVIL